MGHSKMSIRRSRSACPVPLSRPSTRDTQRNHQVDVDPEEAEIARTQDQEAAMRASAVDCQARMDRLKDLILSDQEAEQTEVYDLLAQARPEQALREWMLMKD